MATPKKHPGTLADRYRAKAAELLDQAVRLKAQSRRFHEDASALDAKDASGGNETERKDDVIVSRADETNGERFDRASALTEIREYNAQLARESEGRSDDFVRGVLSQVRKSAAYWRANPPRKSTPREDACPRPAPRDDVSASTSVSRVDAHIDHLEAMNDGAPVNHDQAARDLVSFRALTGGISPTRLDLGPPSGDARESREEFEASQERLFRVKRTDNQLLADILEENRAMRVRLGQLEKKS